MLNEDQGEKSHHDNNIMEKRWQDRWGINMISTTFGILNKIFVPHPT